MSNTQFHIQPDSRPRLRQSRRNCPSDETSTEDEWGAVSGRSVPRGILTAINLLILLWSIALTVLMGH